jgi:hypothetical protein
MKSVRKRWTAEGPIRRIILVVLGLASASCTYMKMAPPPDADKAFLPGNDSCYLATASNLLAGAGYGTGDTVQARTDEIYGEMIAEFGVVGGGWTDAALTWWLGSTENTWPDNPYTVVNVYGYKDPRYPWDEPDGAQTIGNELRSCNFVGLSISWPDATPGAIGQRGHAITGWGDNLGRSSTLSFNPTEVRVTDSDRDVGGDDVQVWNYDAYNNPNPGGANEGDGWYFDYSPDHPYIKHIAVLSPTETAAGNRMAQTVVGSYKIHQDNQTAATDLHYTVGTDVEILSYWTGIDWDEDATPSIEEADPRRSLDVEWDLTANPIPFCNWVTITTEFVLPRWNAITYSDVQFTYPKGLKPEKVAGIGWRLDTPSIENPTAIPNVTGGYVIGAFDIIDPDQPEERALVGEYRFIHQYGFDQTPEEHLLTIAGQSGLYATNLRLGHSYGLPSKKQKLWKFEDWMTEEPEARYELGDKPVEIRVDWTGQLPYPEGEIVPDWMRKERTED